jgi:lysophospholipase L1-like esterase
MNTNPNAIKTICYGDSNTWGFTPLTEKRYPVGVRWTSVLQDKLGIDYWIIEDGLNGRTTNLDDPGKIWRNGFTYLRPCLKSHNPIDLVVIMLGTNDMKGKFNRDPESIAHAIGLLLNEIKMTAIDAVEKTPKLVLVAPPLVDETVVGVSETFTGAGEKSKSLGSLFRQVAQDHLVDFIDIAQYVLPSAKDGIHFDPDSHQMVAEIIFKKINEIF